MTEERKTNMIDDDELLYVNGGIALSTGEAVDDDLRRIKCPKCGNIFMYNVKCRPVICPECNTICLQGDGETAGTTVQAAGTGTSSRMS
jgi:ribosomal protein S27E